MFVKLADTRILDLSTGTCYTYSPASKKKNEASELIITFNGAQTDKYCGGSFADGLWNWLNIAVIKTLTAKFDVQDDSVDMDVCPACHSMIGIREV